MLWRWRAYFCRLKEDAGDGKGSSSTKKKMKMLENELDIKAAALREAEAQLATRTALVEDLENQLRSAGDASTARELNHQLRQMVLVHRQLLRKVRHALRVCVCARALASNMAGIALCVAVLCDVAWTSIVCDD
jgi:hypothetical protein